jgi:hypothetical protein
MAIWSPRVSRLTGEVAGEAAKDGVGDGEEVAVAEAAVAAAVAEAVAVPLAASSSGEGWGFCGKAIMGASLWSRFEVRDLDVRSSMPVH